MNPDDDVRAESEAVEPASKGHAAPPDPSRGTFEEEYQLPYERTPPSLGKRIAMGCAMLGTLGLAAIFLLALWFRHHTRQVDQEVIPYIEAALPEIATWERARIDSWWAPEMLAQQDPRQVDRIFLAFSRLGALRSWSKPELVWSGVSTTVPRGRGIVYQVNGEFEAGPATLTLTLVRASDGSLQLWGLNINSDAFLPELPSPEETTGTKEP